MLELKPVRGGELEALFREQGRVCCLGCGAYIALAQGQTVGFCLFEKQGGTLLLLDARAQDAALADGLVRAALEYAWHFGVAQARFAPSFNPATRQALRAFGHDDESVPDIDNFLTNCKKCAKNG